MAHLSVYPNYYFNFSCIASKCRHSCCKGWIIEVDNETEEYYRINYPDIYSTIDNDSCFKQDINGNCVHLQKDGLCAIQCKSMDILLPVVCDEHPRFTNFCNNGNIYHGLGIVCEEACRIILNSDDHLSFVTTSNDNVFHDEQLEICLHFQELKNVSDLIACLSKDHKVPEKCFSSEFQLKTLSKCEVLDPEWTNILDGHVPEAFKINSEFSKLILNFASYLAYRHRDLFENKRQDYYNFIAFSVSLVNNLSGACKNDDDFLNICRMFSGEIEYSTENIDIIIGETKNETH